jgi:predicted RNase H-like HicB family nuclease
MGDPASDPVRLSILYEPAEQGWITASIPAVPGTISAGRNQQKARENVLDALRLILSTAPGPPTEHVRVEQVDVRLDVVRAHDRGHER